jgi:hypothetical protein
MGGLRIRWKILHLVIVRLRTRDEGVGRSVGLPVNRSVGRSVGQSVGRSAGVSAGRSVGRGVGWAVDEGGWHLLVDKAFPHNMSGSNQ